jgi:hypothetical protein
VLHESFRLALAAIALGDAAGIVRHTATIAYLRSLGPEERQALESLATHEGYQRGVLEAIVDQWPESLARSTAEQRQRGHA